MCFLFLRKVFAYSRLAFLRAAGQFWEFFHEFMVGGSPSFEQIVTQKLSSLCFSPVHIPYPRDNSTIFMPKILPSLLLFIIMCDISKFRLSGNEGDLRESIIHPIQSLPIQRSIQIIPHYMHLVESSPECFRCGQIANVSDPENIFILFVSQSVDINVE